MNQDFSELIAVTNAEYEFISIKSYMNDDVYKTNYEKMVCAFYIKMYEYANECDVNWHYIHRDSLYLGQLYAYYCKDIFEITPKFLISFHNMANDINYPSSKSFHIRVLITKLFIKYKNN
jgi:hypothetical protein